MLDLEQHYFEDDFPEDEEIEKTLRQKIFVWLTRVVLFFAILGLLYLSGFYQANLFRRTPATIQFGEIESVDEYESLTLSIAFYILRSNGDLGSERSDDDIDQLLRNANSIWNQADISLELRDAQTLEMDDERIRLLLNNTTDFLSLIPNLSRDAINVFLLSSLQGINGIAFIGRGSVAVADTTTVNDFRVLAHEIGHMLGLGHVPRDKNSLMFRGANGVDLSLDEIIRAREKTLDFE